MTETKNGAKYIDKDPPMEEGSQSLGRKILDYLAYLKETLNFIFSNYGRRLTDANGNINELHRTATETTSRLADTEGNVTELTQRTDEIESTVSAIDTDMSGLQSQITQNATAIASKVSQTDYNGNTIASLINQTSTSVQIQASKIDLQGYVTFSNLSTSGQTTINGANITTGLIQDQARKNSWNLNTGALTITDGSINITTSSSTNDVIKLSYGNYSTEYTASSVTAAETRNGSYASKYVLGTSSLELFDKDNVPIVSLYSAAYSPSSGGCGNISLYKNRSDYTPSITIFNYARTHATGDTFATYEGDNLSFSEWVSATSGTTVALFGTRGMYVAPTSNAHRPIELMANTDWTGAHLSLGDGSSSYTRTSLTNSGLTFSNSSGNVTASYPASLTASRVLVTNASNAVAVSAVTSTELGYVSGVTSAIQTQLNGKQASISGAASTITSSNLTASRALISNSSGKVAVSAVTSTELGYVSGVTSAIQTQLNGKQATISTTEGTITFASGWTNADPTVISGSLRYTFVRKYGNVVEVCCSCNTSNAYSGWHQIATLPSGFRPTKLFTIHGYNNTDDSNAIFRILSSGEVSVYGDKRQPTLHATFVI